MKVETTIAGLNAALLPARNNRKTIGFVPTMGNLHEGHLSLVREAKKYCDIVVVSIFVNPIQFGAGEDFDNYPRTLEADSHLLADAQCDVLFAPSVQQMYGDIPRQTTISVSGITEMLCGESRPGHFDGVATVVAKFFNIVAPAMAFFGQKDWQQLAVIRTMTRDLNFQIEVVGVPISRAEDGLALSSRNGYLSAQERAIAPLIYQSLQQAKQRLSAGDDVQTCLTEIRQNLSAHGFVVDYVSAFTPDLQPIRQDTHELVIFVAAKLGKTRLIDNIVVKLS